MLRARVPRRLHLLRHRHDLPIKVLTKRDAREREERGHDVRVRRRRVEDRALGDARAAHEEGDVDVLLDVARLAGREAVLPEVEAVVGGVDEVGVREDGGVGGLEAGDDGVDEVVDGL